MTGRRPRRLAVAALIGAGGIAAVVLAASPVGELHGPAEERPHGTAGVGQPTLLQGRGDVRPEGREVPSPAPGAGPEASPAGGRGSVSPLDFVALLWSADDPLAPGSVEDRVAPGAPPALPILRSDLVGRVGAYGVLDPAGAREPRWLGLGRIERPEAPAEAAETEKPPTTAVRGVVLDAERGEPIAGAEVILYSSFYLRHAYYDHRVREIGRAFTDREGRFDLRPVDLDTVHFGSDGEILVTVRHPAWADVVAQHVQGIRPGEESEVAPLRLPARGAVVRGKILDLAGTPVVGAAVRASGVMNPVDYDKTERMVVLKDCPTAWTDAEGAYALPDLAPGTHELSIHVNLDCVFHEALQVSQDLEWTRWVRAGNGVRGRVLDPDGNAVSAAVVFGGGNWTPTNADGTFWLDNTFAGPLDLSVHHHAFATVRVSGVATTPGTEVELRFTTPLPRITLEVTGPEGRAVPLIAIDWTYATPPSPFVPDSRYWNDPAGRFSVIVPEGASGATVSDASGRTGLLAAEALADGARLDVRLEPPPK